VSTPIERALSVPHTQPKPSETIVCYQIEGNFSRTYPFLVGDTCSILVAPSHPFCRDSMPGYSACLVLSWTHVWFRAGT